MICCSLLLCFYRNKAKGNCGSVLCFGAQCSNVWTLRPPPLFSSLHYHLLIVLISCLGTHLNALTCTVQTPSLSITNYILNFYFLTHVSPRCASIKLRYCNACGSLIHQTLPFGHEDKVTAYWLSKSAYVDKSIHLQNNKELLRADQIWLEFLRQSPILF